MKTNILLQKTKGIFLALTFMLTTQATFSFAILSDWKLLRKSDQVSLFYRWVEIGDTLKTREVKAVFEVEAEYSNLLINLKNEEKLSSWTAATRECMVFEKNETNWITYSMMDFPSLFPQKDMLINYQVKKENENIRIQMKSVPNELPYFEGVQRMEYYSGYWDFVSIEDGKYLVEFSSISYEPPIFPRFLQDPVVHRMLISSLEKFILLSENPTYE